MTIDIVTEKLVQQISMTIGEAPENIGTQSPFHELGVDSLGLVELFVFVEKEFGVELMNSEVAQDADMTLDKLARHIIQLSPS